MEPNRSIRFDYRTVRVVSSGNREVSVFKGASVRTGSTVHEKSYLCSQISVEYPGEAYSNKDRREDQ